MSTQAVSTEENTTPARTTWSRKDIHQQVTNTIIAQLEKGVVPWQRPWTSDRPALSLPKNFCTGNRYNGVNIVLLWSAVLDHGYRSNEWASFKQWQGKKECIRKGEKGTLIVYADTFDKEDEEGEVKKIPFLKSSVVFNRCQLQSWKESQTAEPNIKPKVWPNVELAGRIEEFVTNTGAVVEHKGSEAFYGINYDKIVMPCMAYFQDTEACTAMEGYVSTLFHELTHWTGAKHRLNRQIDNPFGTKEYAQEELTAELGAAFLCAEFEISTAEKGNHAAYINSWLKVLKENKKCLIAASSEASKVIQFLERQITGPKMHF